MNLSGQNAISLPYRNIPESDDFEEQLVWIKQCRLHYFFGTTKNVQALFMDKEIELHLFVTRRGIVNETDLQVS